MRRAAALAILAVLVVLLAAVTVGTVPVPPGKALRAVVAPRSVDPATARIVALRLARAALGLVVGAGLAVAGAAFQTLLANPLATPYTVGVAAAGSFGAFLALAVPALAVLGPLGSAPAQALLWAGAELLLVAGLARRARWGPTTLILAGVTCSFLFGAGVMLLRLVADPYRLHGMERWLLGSLAVVGVRPAAEAAVLVAPGVAVLLALAPALDQLAFGERLAHARGVPVTVVRPAVLLAGAWITAACVAQAGPVAFVGLVVPHGVRRLAGAAHRRVLPLAALGGGAFLVAADTLARAVPLLGRGAELPVGAVTALAGGPVFLALLARRPSGPRPG